MHKKNTLVCSILLAFLMVGVAAAQSTDGKAKIRFLAPTIDGPMGFYGLYTAENLRGGEFSLGFNYNNRDRDPGDIEIVTIPITFTLGLHDRVEWYVAAETQRRVDSDGLRIYKVPRGGRLIPAQIRIPGTSNAVPGPQMIYNETPFMDVGWGDTWGYALTGLKLNLLSESKGNPFGLAIRANLRHPFSRKARKLLRGMSSGGTDWGLDMLLSKWAGPVTFLANAGFMDVDDKREPLEIQNEFNWGVGLGFDLGTPKVQLLTELDGTTFWGDRSTSFDGRPILVNPRASVDLVAGLRFFPSTAVTFGGGYRYNARRIDEDKYGFPATNAHGYVVQLAFQRKINEPPTVECRITGPASIIQGQTTTIAVTATDPDDDDLTVTWRATGGRVTGSGMTATFDATGVNPGTYTVTAEVSDGTHVATCSVDITVGKRNVGPTIVCEPASQTVDMGQTVTLRARATDPNGDPLRFTWEVDGQRVAGTTAELVFGTAGKSIGRHTVRVTVSDGELTATCTFDVTIREVVRPNRPPTVDLTVSPKSVLGCETVTATARASDPDGDRLTYEWSVDGRRVAGTGTSITINSCDYSAGRHTVTVRVSDGRADASDTDDFTKGADETIVVAMPGLRVDNVAKAKLDDVALKLQANSRLEAVITGYTDNREPVRNGLTRANRAKDYLVRQHKIDPNRITVKNGGRDNPIGDNSTAEGRRQNRRVEILLTAR